MRKWKKIEWHEITFHILSAKSTSTDRKSTDSRNKKRAIQVKKIICHCNCNTQSLLNNISINIMHRFDIIFICIFRIDSFHAIHTNDFYGKISLRSLPLTFGHILAITAMVGPPTYPAPIQHICKSHSSLILIYNYICVLLLLWQCQLTDDWFIYEETNKDSIFFLSFSVTFLEEEKYHQWLLSQRSQRWKISDSPRSEFRNKSTVRSFPYIFT